MTEHDLFVFSVRNREDELEDEFYRQVECSTGEESSKLDSFVS